MKLDDEVLVLPKPTGPAVLGQTKADLYTNRVAKVRGFTQGEPAKQLVSVKFTDGRYPHDLVWIPRYRLRPYEPSLADKLERRARVVGRRWRAKLNV